MSSDEVGGRFSTKEEDVEKSSDFSETTQIQTGEKVVESKAEDIGCDICKKTGLQIKADGYCKQCNKFLCVKCKDHHKLLDITQGHTILEGSSMPKERPKVKYVCRDICPSHPDKVMEYFCRACDQTGCTSCMTINHKHCSPTEYIPEIVENLENSEEFKDFVDAVDTIAVKLEMNMSTYLSNVQRNSYLKEQVKEALKKHREKVNAMMDEFEKSIEQMINNLDCCNKTMLDNVAKLQDKLQNDLQRLNSDLHTKQGQGEMCDLFFTMKSGQKALKNFHSALESIEKNNYIQNYQFKTLETYSTLAKQLQESAEVVLVHLVTVESVDSLEEIYIKTPGDKMSSSTCSGLCLMSENKLLIADNRNEMIKLVDTEGKGVLSCLSLPSNPWDIAKMDETKVAVTLPDNQKIAFLSADYADTLKNDSEMTVNGSCRGIVYREQSKQLLVTFDKPDPELKVFDTSGNTVLSISKDSKGKNLFVKPMYLTLSPDQLTIYVSDNVTDTITSLTLDGKVKSTFTSNDLKKPEGLTTDHAGAVFVPCSSMYAQNIHKLTDRLTSVQVIQHSLKNPRSLAFSSNKKQLFVGHKFSDNLLKISLKQ